MVETLLGTMNRFRMSLSKLFLIPHMLESHQNLERSKVIKKVCYGVIISRVIPLIRGQ